MAVSERGLNNKRVKRLDHTTNPASLASRITRLISTLRHLFLLASHAVFIARLQNSNDLQINQTSRTIPNRCVCIAWLPTNGESRRVVDFFNAPQVWKERFDLL